MLRCSVRRDNLGGQKPCKRGNTSKHSHLLDAQRLKYAMNPLGNYAIAMREASTSEYATLGVFSSDHRSLTMNLGWP